MHQDDLEDENLSRVDFNENNLEDLNLGQVDLNEDDLEEGGHDRENSVQDLKSCKPSRLKK